MFQLGTQRSGKVGDSEGWHFDGTVTNTKEDVGSRKPGQQGRTKYISNLWFKVKTCQGRRLIQFLFSFSLFIKHFITEMLSLARFSALLEVAVFVRAFNSITAFLFVIYHFYPQTIVVSLRFFLFIHIFSFSLFLLNLSGLMLTGIGILWSSHVQMGILGWWSRTVKTFKKVKVWESRKLSQNVHILTTSFCCFF